MMNDFSSTSRNAGQTKNSIFLTIYTKGNKINGSPIDDKTESVYYLNI
ncbi:hypothetical protein [Piscirickettsia salmonis]|nr:hypothetical protein [Piscirickettsia salmonis]